MGIFVLCPLHPLGCITLLKKFDITNKNRLPENIGEAVFLLLFSFLFFCYQLIFQQLLPPNTKVFLLRREIGVTDSEFPFLFQIQSVFQQVSGDQIGYYGKDDAQYQHPDTDQIYTGNSIQRRHPGKESAFNRDRCGNGSQYLQH